MSFDYDVDEIESEELEYVSVEGGTEYGSEYTGEFEEIDFDSLGIDPSAPTTAKPGTEEKVLMLAARYAAGVPLWHDEDCYDHGPGQSLARLIRKA
ncbi:MAG: hypothetical protein JSS49_12460 [Planctomycetes bacterium]|nr:hypothetical protein [Planctomycetota bacterium]